MFDKFTEETQFRAGNGELVTLKEVVARINEYVKDYEYAIEVGTDSQTNDKTKFVTAIVVRRVGRGGIFFYHGNTQPKIHTLRERIHAETQLSVDLANLVIDLFLDSGEMHEIEIHCDVGEYGKTRSLIREVTGYVTAMGFDCKVKPDSYAASSIADKFSK